MKSPLLLALSGLLIAAMACTINFNLPTSVPSATSTSASAFPWPNESGTCMLSTTGPTTLYDRPSTEAQVFFEEEAGFSAVVEGRTADGWVGFDPGYAQAANVGVFHMRWAFFDDVTLTGNCVAVPELNWVPDPTLCYTMPMSSVNVYSNTNTSSSILATLNLNDFAAVNGYAAGNWAQVDLGGGNTGLTGTGWMERADLNLNGGLCDELPTVSP